MRAIWLYEHGGPERLVPGEAPAPQPGPGEVLIAVEACSVTFVETQLRAATAPFTIDLPAILGNGVGGTVVQLGDGVDERLDGRRVVAPLGGTGGYAELAVARADAVVEVPGGLPLDAATALLADGRTAIGLVERAAPRPGDRVLVEAAAGGVGTLLVQLVRAAGATVVAAAGGERKLELARELGADVAVDYRAPGWAGAVRDAAGGVDVVLDGVGGATARAAFELLGDGGRMLSYGLAGGAWSPVTADEAQRRGVTLLASERPSAEQSAARSRAALELAAGGRLRPVVGQRHPLERAGAAHAAIEARATLGKTLLDVTPA